MSACTKKQINDTFAKCKNPINDNKEIYQFFDKIDNKITLKVKFTKRDSNIYKSKFLVLLKKQIEEDKYNNKTTPFVAFILLKAIYDYARVNDIYI